MKKIFLLIVLVLISSKVFASEYTCANVMGVFDDSNERRNLEDEVVKRLFKNFNGNFYSSYHVFDYSNQTYENLNEMSKRMYGQCNDVLIQIMRMSGSVVTSSNLKIPTYKYSYGYVGNVPIGISTPSEQNIPIYYLTEKYWVSIYDSKSKKQIWSKNYIVTNATNKSLSKLIINDFKYTQFFISKSKHPKNNQ